MIIGIGADLCSIERMASSLERHGARFEARIFTDTERATANQRPFTKAATLAKRFAAKEAFAKAIGTGFTGGVSFKDISVISGPAGAPKLDISGAALTRLNLLVPKGFSPRVHLTLTDDHPWSQAFVIIEVVANQHDSGEADVSQECEQARESEDERHSDDPKA